MSTVQIRSDVRSNPLSAVLAPEIEFLTCTYVDAVDHSGLCTLVVAPDVSYLPHLTPNNVIRIVEDETHALEYRIDQAAQSIGQAAVQVTARPVIHDLNDNPLWQSIGGIPTFTLAASNLSAAEWIDTFILPTLVAAGRTYVTRGTVDSARLMSLSWSTQTSMWLLNELITGTALDIVYRMVNPNGPTESYAIDLVERGALEPRTRIVVGHNATALQWVVDREEQANVIIPLGATPAGGTEPSNIGQYVARVDAVVGGAITLSDPDGNPAPVYADDQVTGQYLELLVPPILNGALS